MPIRAAMLADRVMALRQANVYERQMYRHIIGMPTLGAATGDVIEAETPFLVVRTMRDGRAWICLPRGSAWIG